MVPENGYLKVLLTGGSGFVGRNLVKYLQGKANILQISLRAQIQPLAEDVDIVIHLAGKAHDLKQVASADEYYKVNLDLTKAIYDEFLVSNAEKFIFVSSVKAVADSVPGVLDEEAIPNPGTHYGKSKLLAEEYIKSRPLPAGKHYYILRPCMIHGPGNKGNLNMLYRFVKSGIPYPLAAFSNKRSFLSVENLCFIIQELVSRDIPDGMFNVADDESLSTNQVIKLLSCATGKSPRLLRVPVSWIRTMAKIGDKMGLPLNTERLEKLTENYQVSNSKIKTALGKELPVSSSEGLLLTALSFNS